MGDRLIHTTTSLCGTCKTALDASVTEREGEVWMQKHCAVHGPQQVRLSTDAAWYERTRAIAPAVTPPPRFPKAVEHGCPFDCGPCTMHGQRIRLPVVTITSACNLRCPICYVHNKNADAYHMSKEELGAILDHLAADHGGTIDLLNLTGGDPTLHPELLELLELCHAKGIHRVSICTNGIRLAEDEDFVQRLAALDARIALSFQSFDADVDYDLQGARLLDLKRRCMDLLEKHDVDTTLIPVMTRGVNDHEIGDILRMALARTNVRHVEVHTMTYTGQGGTHRDRSGRISMVEVLDRIAETTNGLLRRESFVPSPSAHPLCYQIAYLLIDPEGGSPIPFLDFVTRDEMYACLGEHLYLEPTPRLESTLRGAIDRLFAEDDAQSERTLRILKQLIARLFPRKPLSRQEALRVAERAAKAIYVHSHMDEETFDVERVAQCCDSNCYADGTSIPVCAYNVLYRERESKFMREPKAWPERDGNRRLPLWSSA
jgi:uncharacterized radical SAM superfamily Fe-S cluster-containing enzyme